MSIRYCGRDFSPAELEFIRHLIAEEPARNRAELSRLTCQTLEWNKPDGGLKAMSCRVAMLRMEADGLILLPPPRRSRPDPRVHITTRSDAGVTIEQPAPTLRPLLLQVVRDKSDSRLWNEYIERYLA